MIIPWSSAWFLLTSKLMSAQLPSSVSPLSGDLGDLQLVNYKLLSPQFPLSVSSLSDTFVVEKDSFWRSSEHYLRVSWPLVEPKFILIWALSVSLLLSLRYISSSEELILQIIWKLPESKLTLRGNSIFCWPEITQITFGRTSDYEQTLSGNGAKINL